MSKTQNRGMLRRTLKIYTEVRIPWHLYIIQTLVGVLSAKVALMYIPYESEMKLGNLESMSVAWGYVGCMLLVLLTQVGAHIPEFYAKAMIARGLRDRLIDHSLRLPMRTFEENSSRMVGWITQNGSSADGLIGTVVSFITGFASVLMTIDRLTLIDQAMVALVPSILAYVLFSTWLEGKLLFLRQQAGKRANAELTAFLAEHLSFFLQIRQLHSRAEEQVRGRAAIDSYYKLDIHQAVLTLVNNIVSGSLTSIINILVFALGVPMVRSGKIAMPDLVSFQSYILLAYNSLSCLPSLYTSVMYYNGELYYAANLLAQKEEQTKRTHGMDRPDEDISFEQVSFAYDEAAPVLKNVSFTIPKGQVTAIAGPNGSGKTTLFRLIQRFYTPDSGTVRFGTLDAETIHLDEWRQSIAYVLQEPQLFNGSVRDNITYGLDRPATDEEVRNAAILASADEFISGLPEGYDFNIGDNGSRLSAGQRQRLAIARAVMLDPAYLLLDEATCNMDVLSESSVTAALLRLMKDRTTVLITHDMKMLEHCDNVIVLKDGTLEAAGPRETVERQSPTLRRLMEAERKEQTA